MKPSELQLLVGRHVDCYWEGQRSGKVVAAPKTDTLTVQFHASIGKRRVDVNHVVGVYWFGKKRTIAEYLRLRVKQSEAPNEQT